MQVGPVHDLVLLENRLQAIQTSATRLKTQRDTLQSSRESFQQEIISLSASVEMLTKAGELLHALMDKMVLSQVKSIESVVTDGLRTIFYDQDLKFEAEVGQSRGKVSIELLIRNVQNSVEIVGSPLETNGGGVSSVAALILRLLTLVRLQKFPLLLLDETLSAVSAEYTDQTGQLLAKLSSAMNIPLLLVTHNTAFLDHAKTAYQGHQVEQNGVRSFGLKKMRGGED